MADPFKVIGGTNGGDGVAVARAHRRSFNSLFLQSLPAAHSYLEITT